MFPTFPTILTLIMYEYSKFRDRPTFEMVGKQLSFWTTGWKNISFLTLESWKNMYFCPKRLEFYLLIDVGHHANVSHMSCHTTTYQGKNV